MDHEPDNLGNPMETIGNKLKAAREKIKLSRADIAKTARMKTQYVEAIENNEFHNLIAPIYAKGFIKLYAQCVQLDPEPLLRQFSALEVPPEPAPVRRKLPDKKEFFSQKRRFPHIRFAGLAAAIKKIKLPETIHSGVSSLKSLEAPVKKRIALIIAAAALCAVILPILARHMTASSAKLRVPPACRWIAEPPEPYLNMPVQKTSNRR